MRARRWSGDGQEMTRRRLNFGGCIGRNRGYPQSRLFRLLWAGTGLINGLWANC